MLGSIVSMVSERRPLLFFGAGGAVFCLLGVGAGARVLAAFARTKRIRHRDCDTDGALLDRWRIQRLYGRRLEYLDEDKQAVDIEDPERRLTAASQSDIVGASWFTGYRSPGERVLSDSSLSWRPVDRRSMSVQRHFRTSNQE